MTCTYEPLQSLLETREFIRRRRSGSPPPLSSHFRRPACAIFERRGRGRREEPEKRFFYLARLLYYSIFERSTKQQALEEYSMAVDGRRFWEFRQGLAPVVLFPLRLARCMQCLDQVCSNWGSQTVLLPRLKQGKGEFPYAEELILSVNICAQGRWGAGGRTDERTNLASQKKK